MGCGASKAQDQPGRPVDTKLAEMGSKACHAAVATALEVFELPPVPGSLPDDAQIIFVLGGPGSGKGTQCDKIKADYECVHLSAGDLLREEVKSGSVVGKKCEELMRDGKLVPVAVTLSLLKKAMIESGGKFFLVDGFPRALDQASEFESAIMPCKAVLFFDCPEEEMEKRLLKRGETSGRSDDNAETIRKRFKTFLEQSLPVKDHFLAKDKCHVLSAVPPPDEVYEKVKVVLDALNAPKKEGFELPPVPGSLPDDAQIVFVLGGPGSGKGTQCEQILEEYECVHLSAGDLLRAEVKSGSVVGKKCEELMKEGKLVPFAVTLNLLKKAMIESGGTFFLIDGFPRALDQASEFESAIMPCKAVLFFDLPEATMEQRLLKRGETSGRSDDNADTIRKRFRTFVESSLPVKDHYLGQGKCHVISAAPPPKEVFEAVKAVLDGMNAPRKSDEIVLPPVPGSLPADSQIIFVLGGPGSGKGTQCDKIKVDYECVHLSAGDLLRAEVKSGSVVGKKCEELMREGKLVPFAVTLNLLKKAMIESGGTFFLIDGFPRALDQGSEFESAIMPCKAVLFFDCPEEEMEKRLIKRGETSGRSDDNAETIRKRFKTFLDQSLPVKDHYLAQGKCHVISAVATPDEVYEKVKVVLDGMNAPEKAFALPPVPGSLPADSQIVFVLGGPGSGKGTQCEQIKEEYECVHLSAGDLLRAEVKSGSVVGKKCEELMKEGKLVPFAVTLNLLKKAMIESGGTFFLIDGFPRALDQASEFESAIMPCKAVLFFDLPEATMEQRLLKRGETSGRSDDNADTIRKRFRTFVESSLPVKDHYLAQGKCHVISSEPAPKDVFEEVKKVLDSFPAPRKSDEIVLPPVPGSLPADSQIIFVLGGPGSGKGTQCDKIKEEYECVHLSAGDLLRAEVKSGSVVGKKCEELMREGKLVPFAVTLNLLKKAMIESGGTFFLIDGFPRALDQGSEFESAIMPCKAVLFFDCSEEEMEKRLLKRGETSGRSDDNAETIRKRFKTFLGQSLPVKDHYLALNKCHVISSVPPPDEVYGSVKAVLDRMNAPKK